MGNKVYLNRPIRNYDEDWIGISTYVEKLNDAIESDAKIIAVTSDFGAGKSSLISLYENNYIPQQSDKWFYCIKKTLSTGKKSANSKRGKQLVHINMWGDYDRLRNTQPKDVKAASIELHKSLLYQIVSQIDSRKSNYISRRLSKDFGTFSIIGKSRSTSFLAAFFVIMLFVLMLSHRFVEKMQEVIGNEQYGMWAYGLITLLFFASIIGLVFAVVQSEIIFSSRKSEGNQNPDENILISLFKQEVVNRRGGKHYIIVIEDLDRVEDKESALLFLRELRRYYLVESSNRKGKKNKISFIVCIKPETMLKEHKLKDSPKEEKEQLDVKQPQRHCVVEKEYKKIFDYTINLQKINIDNFDSILKGLLDEGKDWIRELGLEPVLETPGMTWVIQGKNLDIREVKARLNEALTLYESLKKRFPAEEKREVISFEKCAVATYLRREYEEDFYKLEDNALDILISQLAIKREREVRNDEGVEGWNECAKAFRDEIVRLIKDKKIDATYRLYFYNYPSDSKVFSASEMRVYNSIVYCEEPRAIEKDQYQECLKQTPIEIIEDAYQRISALNVKMPLFLIDYDKLFVTLYNSHKEKLFELIQSQILENINEEELCDLIEDCVREREGEYAREMLISELSQLLSSSVKYKTVLSAIRQRLCEVIPEKVKLLSILFQNDNSFITPKEVEAINDVSIILSVANYSRLGQAVEAVTTIHRKLLSNGGWSRESIEFYVKVVEFFGIADWKDALAEICSCYGTMPNEIVGQYEKAIIAKAINVSDYVECIESVGNLGKRQLKVLADYQWIGGLSERLCNLMFDAGYYLEYVCNAALLEDKVLLLDNANVFSAIDENAEWIEENSPTAFYGIRRRVLSNHLWIEKYKRLFKEPHPVLSQEELIMIKDLKDALALLEERAVTEAEVDKVVEFFNSKYRNATAAYEIISFILNQDADIARNMFYALNPENIPYVRMSRRHKKEIREKAFELFEMEDKPQERVRFLKFTGVPAEGLEKDLWPELNEDEKLRKEYVSYANSLEKVPDYTAYNISRLNTVTVYSKAVNAKLYELKDYENYISSKTALEEAFIIEYDKVDMLWLTYVKMFNSPLRERTRGYMSQNEEFMTRLIEAEGYLHVGEHIEYYSAGKQSVDLLNYVTENYDKAVQQLYLRKIEGFKDYDAAHRFCEIARDNSFIGGDEGIYNNAKGKLWNSGLESWLTKIYKKAK